MGHGPPFVHRLCQSVFAEGWNVGQGWEYIGSTMGEGRCPTEECLTALLGYAIAFKFPAITGLEGTAQA